jgi:hypothetical protein
MNQMATTHIVLYSLESRHILILNWRHSECGLLFADVKMFGRSISNIFRLQMHCTFCFVPEQGSFIAKKSVHPPRHPVVAAVSVDRYTSDRILSPVQSVYNFVSSSRCCLISASRKIWRSQQREATREFGLPQQNRNELRYSGLLQGV